MNEEQPAGNYVIIKHENGEYSMLAHFKQSSILVKEGQKVMQGEIIGLCGNSGNSSEAHIHFQVMDSPDLYTSRSIRIQFADEEEPVQGDFVFEKSSNKKESMDPLEKAEIALSITDIARFIGSLFTK